MPLILVRTGEAAALPVAVTLGSAVQLMVSTTWQPRASRVAERRRAASKRKPSTNSTHSPLEAAKALALAIVPPG